ncbi:DoxX family protein [Bordetella sp. LUAb4]|uniref:DoxX family protein n=1 Tax=Bordetella sp. LUAb4 TaxID=2843195 RepID=UPI001E2BF0E5|nr:DoxX family protein [Bordetella sp. LUAb4]
MASRNEASAIHEQSPFSNDRDRLLIPALGSFYHRADPLAYALLRIAFGLVILTHGIPKVLGESHGSMGDPMAGATNMIANVLNLPFAPQLAVAAMLLETVGAIAVATGFVTRFFAAALTVEMVVICFAHAPTFAWIDRGFEYPLILAFLALYIAIMGGGRYSLDRWLPRAL